MKRTLIGLQWGDEGKGKFVSYFVLQSSGKRLYVIRYNGAANAGHTIITQQGEKIATHLLPSGIPFPNTYNAMLCGMYIDPLKLMLEIDGLKMQGYEVSPVNLGISGLAHVTLDYHNAMERQDEKARERPIGTTLSGVGPTTVDKYARKGIRFAEFVEPEAFRRLLASRKAEFEAKGLWDKVERYDDIYVCPQAFLKQFLIDEAELYKSGENEDWLYEGAQGVLLDIDYGTYEFVTTSHVARPPHDTDEVVGVAKAYVTRVGGGPLPTKMEQDIEEKIRGARGTVDAEYGATTGRPRSCGWFDIPATKYAATLSGTDKMALTKLDVLSRVPEIKVCTHYDCKGKKLQSVPANRFDLEQCKPVYKTIRGWPGIDISNAREFADLPQTAQDYTKMLEDLTGCKIGWISVGPSAEQTILCSR